MVDVRGDVLRPPNCTAPAAVKANKNQKWDPLKAMNEIPKPLACAVHKIWHASKSVTNRCTHAKPKRSMALQLLWNWGHNLWCKAARASSISIRKRSYDKRRYIQFSPAESGLDLDLGYIQNVLTDYDSKYLQTSESDWCHLVTIGQFAKFKMAAKMVVNY